MGKQQKKPTADPVEQKPKQDQDQDKAPETVEATENEKPEGVETVEQQAAPEAEQAKPEATADPVEQKPSGKAKAYAVRWTLKRNGKRYEAGDKVQLTAEEFEALKATGVLEV